MKQLRYLFFAVAVTCWGASAAFACDGDKASAANAGSGDCCAHAKASSASAHNTRGAGTTAVTAVASGSCTAAMRAQCMKGASAAAMEHCAKGAMAGKGSCSMHGATASAMASKCELHGMANHADCAVCADEASCDDEVRATGARSQIVSLRNGTMIVYTAEGASNVRALQAAVARHNDRVLAALNGRGESALCGECKILRGAMASGKFSREVVNVERGCQVLMTSSDRAIVQKIHDETTSTLAVRIKS